MTLLDTDICIEILRGNKRVIRRRKSNEDQIAISFMTAGELYFGAQNSSHPDHNRTLVDTFLLSVRVLESNPAIMRQFGDYKARLKKEGNLLPDADILVAATAKANGAQLVTGNSRHFQRFKDVPVENWRE